MAAPVSALVDDPSGVFAASPAVALVMLDLVGGGRGVVTTRAVQVGEVLLREAPFFPVPVGLEATEGETLHSLVAKEIVRADAGRSPQLTQLHPLSLQPPHLTAEQLQFATAKHGDAISALLADTTTPTGYTFDEVLRIVLAVQFNAFSSGMYFALAMINHACSPNCSKFAPRVTQGGEGGGAKDGADGADGAGGYDARAIAGPAVRLHTNGSEIVACRNMLAGEEVTIHYSTTVERAFFTRDNAFRGQHYMPLPPSPFNTDLDGELDAAQVALVKKLDAELDELEEGAANKASETTAIARLDRATVWLSFFLYLRMVVSNHPFPIGAVSCGRSANNPRPTSLVGAVM
jgi:hypothetical protein